MEFMDVKKVFVFDIINMEYEFDYSLFSEISPWAYFKLTHKILHPIKILEIHCNFFKLNEKVID